ncbi:MAG: hypothetical protein H0T78_10670 [Longispora sp.]|nr:hypothetical protein [Longispora sp. (in: high G+C Gram-positive bacteria)]
MSWWNGALVRLAAMLVGIAAGVFAGWPTWAWAGAAAGYLLVHTIGWAFDRTRPTSRRLGRPPTHAQRYKLRTTTLPGSMAAGIGFGLLGVLALAATFGLISNAVARRFAAGAPLLFAAGVFTIILCGVLLLRRAVLSDVEVVLGVETLVLRVRRRRQPWQELRLPLSSVQSVTRFRDPYGPGRWARVNIGVHGRFELRATGVLAGKRAQAAIDALGRDLLDRLELTEGTRPYLARWGTAHYSPPPGRITQRDSP